MVSSIPSDGNPGLKKTGTLTANTFDDDYEPVRPSMANQSTNDGYPAPGQPTYNNFNENEEEEESYDENITGAGQSR